MLEAVACFKRFLLCHTVRAQILVNQPLWDEMFATFVGGYSPGVSR